MVPLLDLRGGTINIPVPEIWTQFFLIPFMLSLIGAKSCIYHALFIIILFALVSTTQSMLSILAIKQKAMCVSLRVILVANDELADEPFVVNDVAMFASLGK